jgi:hypothetical protein
VPLSPRAGGWPVLPPQGVLQAGQGVWLGACPALAPWPVPCIVPDWGMVLVPGGKAGVAHPARRPIKKLCKTTQLALSCYTRLYNMKV